MIVTEQHSNNQHSKWIQSLLQNREFVPAAVNPVKTQGWGDRGLQRGTQLQGGRLSSEYLCYPGGQMLLQSQAEELLFAVSEGGLETYGSSRCWELVMLSAQSLNRTSTHHLECLRNMEEEGWKECKIWKKGQRVARCYLWAWHSHCNHYPSYTEWAHTRPDFSMVPDGRRRVPVSLALPAELLDAGGF